jgi:hypothetical protein
MTTTTTLYSAYITVDDNPQAILNVSLPFYSANFHIEDNDVYYGNGSNMTAIAVADSVISLEKGDLAHIFFKNKTPASVAHVSIVATVDIQDVRRQSQSK